MSHLIPEDLCHLAIINLKPDPELLQTLEPLEFNLVRIVRFRNGLGDGGLLPLAVQLLEAFACCSQRIYVADLIKLLTATPPAMTHSRRTGEVAVVQPWKCCDTSKCIYLQFRLRPRKTEENCRYYQRSCATEQKTETDSYRRQPTHVYAQSKDTARSLIVRKCTQYGAITGPGDIAGNSTKPSSLLPGQLPRRRPCRSPPPCCGACRRPSRPPGPPAGRGGSSRARSGSA